MPNYDIILKNGDNNLYPLAHKDALGQVISDTYVTNTGISSALKYATLSLPTAGWSTATYPVLTATLTGAVATSHPIVDLNITGGTVANLDSLRTEWAKVFSVETTLNTITFTAVDTPTMTIPVQVRDF